MLCFCNRNGMLHFYDGYHFFGMHVMWWFFWIFFVLIMFAPYEPVRGNRRKKKEDMISKS
jgi:putative membrane protein